MMYDQGIGVYLPGERGGPAVPLSGTLLAPCICSTIVVDLAATLAPAWACGAAMSTPAIAIAGAALYAVSATFCTCDGLACLPVRLTFRGRRCLCDEFTALPYSFHARRIIMSNGPVPRPPFIEAYNGNAALATHSEYGPADRRVQTLSTA